MLASRGFGSVASGPISLIDPVGPMGSMGPMRPRGRASVARKERARRWPAFDVATGEVESDRLVDRGNALVGVNRRSGRTRRKINAKMSTQLLKITGA